MLVRQPASVINTSCANAMDHKMDKDAGGPYQALKQIMTAMMKNTSNPKQSSPPSVIAKTISRALKSKNPKTRYAAGKNAK